jgi:predicted Zn-dependent peptidase
MVLSIAGNIEGKSLYKILERSFGNEKTGIKSDEPRFNTDDYSNFSINLHSQPRPQIRFILTFPTFGLKEVKRVERIKLNVLNHIFGRGAASRLFQRLREKERYVYSTGSRTYFDSWMGSLGIWGSVPIEKLLPAMKALKEEIDQLVNLGVTDEEINRSRNYMSASILLNFDNPESVAHYFGDQVIDDEKVWFPEKLIQEAKKITKEELNNLAKNVFDYSKINISFLGNVPDKTMKAAEKIFKV